MEVVGIGKMEAGHLEAEGILCGWFGEHISLSQIGPELEAEAKVREAGSQ